MKSTVIMGILNVTPDSFSDGGIYFGKIEKAVNRVKEMLNEGADIIDIGGESTRPGSVQISAQEELKRILPVINAVKKELGEVSLSVDTYKSKVARVALEHGVSMINSMGGMKFDTKLADVIAKFKCQFVIYHIKGVPGTMQQGEIIYKDVVGDIINFFQEEIAFGVKKGIKREQFIIDPGIGFRKTVQQNLEIIKRLGEFTKLGLPILIGASRKSHLGLILKEKLGLDKIPTSEERLEASLAETTIAVQNGATIIRTHDILQTKKFLTVLRELQ